MRTNKNIIVLSCVLLLLVVSYFGLSYLKSRNSGKLNVIPSETVQILKLDRTSIVDVELENGDERFIFEKVEGQEDLWKATYPENFPLESEKVRVLVSQAANFIGDKLIEENAEDLSVYGLDNPVKVTVKTSKGESATIEIGDQTEVKSGYYVKLQGENKVYYVKNHKAEVLALKYTDLKTKKLFFQPVETITGVSLERKGEKVFTILNQGEADWFVTYPVVTEADVFSLGEMLSQVPDYAVKEWVEKDVEDLSKYGLDKPSYRYTIKTVSGDLDMFFGKEKIHGKQIYGRLADSRDVFLFDESFISFIDKPFKEVVDAFAYLAKITEVKTLTLNMDGRTINAEIMLDPEGDKSADKFKVNGKDANAKDETDQIHYFKKFFNALISIRMDDVELGVKPEGDPEITITYNLNTDPGVMKVEFIPKDKDSYYVLRNKVYTNIIVEDKAFDAVREALKTLEDSMK